MSSGTLMKCIAISRWTDNDLPDAYYIITSWYLYAVALYEVRRLVFTASILSPNEGTAKSWITSCPVTINRTCVSTGTTTRLSTSSNRNCPNSRSDSGTMYESNSIDSPSSLMKSEYSYANRLDYITLLRVVSEGNIPLLIVFISAV